MEDAEQARADERLRQVAEDIRHQQETVRQNQERERVTAEDARIVAEHGRIQAVKEVSDTVATLTALLERMEALEKMRRTPHS